MSAEASSLGSGAAPGAYHLANGVLSSTCRHRQWVSHRFKYLCTPLIAVVLAQYAGTAGLRAWAIPSDSGLLA